MIRATAAKRSKTGKQIACFNLLRLLFPEVVDEQLFSHRTFAGPQILKHKCRTEVLSDSMSENTPSGDQMCDS